MRPVPLALTARAIFANPSRDVTYFRLHHHYITLPALQNSGNNQEMSAQSVPYHRYSTLQELQTSGSYQEMCAIGRAVSQKTLDRYCVLKATGVSLKQLHSAGVNLNPHSLLKSAQFLHREIPVRMSHRIRDLQSLPFGLSSTEGITEVTNMLKYSFHVISTFQYPETGEDEERMTEVIKEILIRHQHLVVNMGRGFREHFGMGAERDKSEHFLLQEFLDNFNTGRIGLRMLMAHHVALSEQAGNDKASKADKVGAIDENCKPADIVQEAIRDAGAMCMAYYGVAPSVEVSGHTDCQFRFVSAHLRLMTFELLKNSMRSVVEYNTAAHSTLPAHPPPAPLPPIKVVIACNDREVVIKITDQGGGVRRRDLPMLMTYSYTTSTAEQESTAPLDNSFSDSLRDAVGPITSGTAPMFGDGFGLPITRLYSRYFGGDLLLHSMHGHGTDAYLFLNRLGTSSEMLPDGNRFEAGQLY
mmetsp:Transcript_13206/g.25659  ORF Transcript_13206/g.25659 Transcript_13206/m.25659 type:complete len:472 (+) Transcript_13206:54-1469(+)